MSCVRPVGLCLLMVAIASRAGEGPQQTVVTIAFSEAGFGSSKTRSEANAMARRLGVQGKVNA